MPTLELNGDQALAYGAIAAGVSVVASYPGSPSSGTVDVLIDLAESHGHHVEWSTNEKVAIEVGIGASIAGRRALICAKSVGMNLMLDPLMALNLTPVHGGLVILVGDDPGGYGSQNDQDTRPLAQMIEMPWMEPSTPAEGYEMMLEAFELSERLNTTVVIRETRSFTLSREEVTISCSRPADQGLGTERVPWRFTPVPLNAVAKHKALHEQVDEFQEWSNVSQFNTAAGDGHRAIIAAGFAHSKLLDVIGDSDDGPFAVLKLGVLFPIPHPIVVQFLSKHEEVLVLEENEPYVETMIKAIGYEHGCGARVRGKLTGDVHREGELFRWQIQQALDRFEPEFTPARSFLEANENDEHPTRERFCGACGYDAVLDALEAAGQDLGLQLMLIGDPGCLVTVGERLHAKYALGSAVSVAHGLVKAGAQETPVAIFGDSAFFHTAVPAICNAAYNRCDLLIVVLDNRTTMTSGLQPNPCTGVAATGKEAPTLSIAEVARACGVQSISRTDTADGFSGMHSIFHEALAESGLRMVIARTPTGNE